MLVDELQFQNLFEIYKSEMHCQVLLVVVDNTVWEQHEFDDLEPMCVTPPDIDSSKKPACTQMQPDLPHLIDLEPQLDPPMQPEPPQPHDPEPQPHPTMPTSTERKQSKGVEEEYVGVNDGQSILGRSPNRVLLDNAPLAIS